MKRVERVLLQLVVIHLLILVVVQFLLQDLPWFSYTNPLIQFEGVYGIESQDSFDVFSLERFKEH